jgi:hypothetical protein
MATVKKCNLTAQRSLSGWWKHLRRVGKRLYWKAERKAAKLETKR